MLENSTVFATIPVSDTGIARQFYEGILGLTVLDSGFGGVQYAAGNGTKIFTYPTPNAGKSPATVASWLVDDIEAITAQLTAKGIRLEAYDMPGMKTVDGIATIETETMTAKAAWFKDPDGNVLGLTQYIPH